MSYTVRLTPLAEAVPEINWMLLNPVVVLPDLGEDFRFYPRPWISTLLLGALFLYVGSFTLQPLAADAGRAAVPVTYALMLAVIACAWAAPGTA